MHEGLCAGLRGSGRVHLRCNVEQAPGAPRCFFIPFVQDGAPKRDVNVGEHNPHEY